MSRLALRILTGLWALWFTAALVEPAALQTCPTHSAHAGHGHAMAGGSASHSGGTKHGARGHHSSSSCTCLGACCCAPTVAVADAEVAELTVAVILIDAGRPALAADVRPASAILYAHPFANGPPALA